MISTKLEEMKKPIAPHVTDQMVDELIAQVSYSLLPNGRSTVCQLILMNGYSVEGISSLVGGAAYYDEEVGRSRAYDKARNEVYKIASVLLSERLYQEGLANSQKQKDVLRGIGMYFKHYSGSIYKLLHTVKNESDLMEMAVYQSVADGEKYTRPISEFYEKFTCVTDLNVVDAVLLQYQGEYDELMLKYSHFEKRISKGQGEASNLEWQLINEQLLYMRNYSEVLLARMQLLAQKKESQDA